MGIVPWCDNADYGDSKDWPHGQGEWKVPSVCQEVHSDGTCDSHAAGPLYVLKHSVANTKWN